MGGKHSKPLKPIEITGFRGIRFMSYQKLNSLKKDDLYKKAIITNALVKTDNIHTN
jgi:hypothetical protein